MAASANSLRLGKHPGLAPGIVRSDEDAFERYLNAVDELLATGADDVGGRVKEEVRKLVASDDWLPADCCEPGEDCYRRHLLYADPAGRYTVLAIVWRPGQTTPVHGHTAWGAVGVYRGQPSVAVYHRCCGGGAPVEKAQFTCCPGEVSHVDEGIDEPHRIFNASDDLAVTIHTYGRDLTEDPASINILIQPH